MENSALYYPPQ